MGESKNKLTTIVISIVIAAYFVESSLYGLFAGSDTGVFKSIILQVPLSEIVTRIILTGTIIITAFLIKSTSTLQAMMMVPRKEKPASEPENFRMLQKLISDMRIPMNSITGFTELLKDPQVDKLTSKSYLHNISTSSRFAVELIDMLEDIYHINTKTLEFNNDHFDLNTSLDDLSVFMEEKKNEMGASFVVINRKKGVKGTFSIISDRKRLELILSNLIENSLKYTKRGYITFGYEYTSNNSISFFVKDTGKSPSQERINYIISSSSNSLNIAEFPFDSYALKLVYANRIISMMGGTMTVNVYPGDETEYHFSLPFKSNGEISEKKIEQDTETDQSPITQAREIEQPVFENSKILVAEDNASNFILLQELLIPYKVELLWAKNGEEAINILKQKKEDIDLVLMDILMPKMDGYEAARQIKEISPDTPIVAQTAYSIENVRDKKVLQNFDGYLIKPIWSVNLRDVIVKFLK